MAVQFGGALLRDLAPRFLQQASRRALIYVLYLPSASDPRRLHLRYATLTALTYD